MRILLDTQCWLWMTLSPERFSAAARAVVEAEGNALYLSAASVWEIAIKHALRKLRLPEPPVTYVPARVAALGIQPLAIEHQHVLHVATLPAHHRDPFDRLLVAQAQLDDLPILTADPLIGAYDVATIAATGP
jgi:PIN domain nuclease of toxin-antitoxin system